MKIAKFELTRALDKVKTIVTKNEQFPALQGVLVRDGWLTSSNMLITIQVKLEGTEGEEMILPMQSFNLINSFPEGEIEITSKDDEITIKCDRIKNKYKSWPVEQFNFYKGQETDKDGLPVPTTSVCVEGGKLIEAINHVAFAAAGKGERREMTGIFMCSKNEHMELVALDGHILAVDKINAIGVDQNMELIIPKEAAVLIPKIGMIDDVEIIYGKNSVEFSGSGYKVICRLIDGKYFAYDKMMQSSEIRPSIKRKALLDAVSRAKICVDSDKPTVFTMDNDSLVISSAKESSEYAETLFLNDPLSAPFKIGFNPKLVEAALKAFNSEDVIMNLISKKSPMILESETEELRIMVLPVNIAA